MLWCAMLLTVFIQNSLLCHVFYSQCGQDQYVLKHFFSEVTDGFFVDIGAYDGISFSNTKLLEELGWKGICIEPLPEIFQELCNNRSCICVNGCITNNPGMVEFTQIVCPSVPTHQMLSGITQAYDPRHVNRINQDIAPCNGSKKTILVQGYLLSDILDSYHISHVNYLTLDVEGGELEILKSIPFNRITIDVIDVENNYGDPGIRRFLESRGFKYVTRLVCDEIYINKQFEKELNRSKHGKKA